MLAPENLSLPVSIVLFIGAAAVIGVCGIVLAKRAEYPARETGLGRAVMTKTSNGTGPRRCPPGQERLGCAGKKGGRPWQLGGNAMGNDRPPGGSSVDQ